MLTSHNINRYHRVRFYAFVGQPLSKQLYQRELIMLVMLESELLAKQIFH